MNVNYIEGHLKGIHPKFCLKNDELQKDENFGCSRKVSIQATYVILMHITGRYFAQPDTNAAQVPDCSHETSCWQ